MDNWSKIEFICTTKLGVNLLVLDQLEFWRIEKLLQNYQESLEQEKRHHDKQQKEQDKQAAASKTTSTGNLKMPKMEMPRLNMPRL